MFSIQIPELDLDYELKHAIDSGVCGDIDVLAEIALKHPETIFFREGLYPVTYSGEEILQAKKHNIKIR